MGQFMDKLISPPVRAFFNWDGIFTINTDGCEKQERCVFQNQIGRAILETNRILVPNSKWRGTTKRHHQSKMSGISVRSTAFGTSPWRQSTYPPKRASSTQMSFAFEEKLGTFGKMATLSYGARIRHHKLRLFRSSKASAIVPLSNHKWMWLFHWWSYTKRVRSSFEHL